MAEENTPSFEQTLEELEAVVERLEQGDAPLEESLQNFQSGMQMAARLRVQLEQAEQRIAEVIEKHGGGTEVRPMESDDET